MRNALDPITDEPITPEAHAVRERKHGKKAICSSCKSEVFDYGVGSLQVMSHFTHVANSGPCDLKAPSKVIDESVYTDVEAGKKLRSQFMHPDYIKLAFSACETMVCGALTGNRYVPSNFTVNRFAELLDIADKKHTWRLKNLTPVLMPYELVAYETFSVRYRENSNKGISFTFVFDKPPLFDNKERDRFDRSIPVNPDKPIYVVKRFANDNGSIGNKIDVLDPQNPYLISEPNAIELGGPNWSSSLPDFQVQSILRHFKR